MPTNTIALDAPRRWFLVPAPGHYGDRTRVISSHRSLLAARRAVRTGLCIREGRMPKGHTFLRADEQFHPIVPTASCI